MAKLERARSSRQSNEESRIDATATVRGRVRGEGDLIVLGTVEGDISVGGSLTVGEGARIVTKGPVEAEEIHIAGALEAEVSAKGMVRILRGGKLRGNVTGQGFVLEEGAEFAGHLAADFDLPDELKAPSGASRVSDSEKRRR
ncbi:MAG: polymer-forming cytoskeletal protein [Polyangiaceae bacterium]